MDNMDRMCIRFHFGGTFTTVGSGRGDIAESWIDVDRLSFFEIKGHVTDHYNATSVLRLYWLKPGMHIDKGLVLLLDDDSCQVMASYHSDGSCVDMYVEEVAMEINADDQDIWLGDDEGGDDANDEDMPADVMPSPLMDDKDYQSYMAFYKSPSKNSDKGKRPAVTEDEEDSVQMSSDDTSDEEYKQPSEEDSSADDELRNYARQIKRNIRAKKLGIHASEIVDIRAEDLVDEVPNLDEPGSPFLDSSDEYSYEENSDGETERWKTLENRFDSKAELPAFSLGMAFRCSRQFKKALVKYGLKAHKSLKFVKDEKTKVRAICDWPAGCNWLIYGSKTTRSQGGNI
ncbi:unnamed protein product [Miscanthus lutarioriparius]|uniref:Transposase MuDR plant domain-containing protein n=1 Tax=Miscanthus lutarioriparius TaxID=422564 RepID=A0A811PYA8_9POAL|nr:unnamed protein product [Miscanthus lutarioriparius]